LIEWPENGTIQISDKGFTFWGFETGVDRFTYLVSDRYLTSNIGRVLLLFGDADLNPDIDGDGDIDLVDAVMGLKDLAGGDSEGASLRDVIFGLMYFSK